MLINAFIGMFKGFFVVTYVTLGNNIRVTGATMSSTLGSKVRKIRESEGLTRLEFFELTGIPEVTQKFYETDRRGISGDTLSIITNNDRFKKYTLWLMTNETAPESGQISPTLSPDGQELQTSHHSGRKIG